MPEQGQSRSGRLEAVDLPGNYLGDAVPLLVGIQWRDAVEQVVPVTSGQASFTFDFRLVEQEGSLDIRGPFVHGRKGDRFLYVSWGHVGDAEPFVRYARSKLMFNDVPPEVLHRLHADDDHVLVATFEATNSKGTEASGTIRPPRVAWRLDPSAPSCRNL